MRRLSIIIPVYNERATASLLLHKVLNIALPSLEKEIIVVESNSTDGTRAIVKELEAQGRITALYEDRPQGKGHAVKAGLEKAHGDWILIQDADLEYDVEDYPALLAPLMNGTAAFVLGSRHLGRQDWRYRRTGAGRWLGPIIDIGIWCYTQFFNLLYGTALTDPATMYKVFRRNCLEGIRLESDGFELDWEIVAKMTRKGFQPLEIPVTYHSRSFIDGKKVRLWRDGWRALSAIVRFRFCQV